MTFIDKLESKLGRFAIPGLVQIVAILQLLTLGLFIFLSAEARQPFLDLLVLDPQKVLRGEVWRLLTYVFIPRSSSLLWTLIGALFLMWIGRGLDEAWGAFKVNLYLVGGMVSLAVGSLLLGFDANALWLFQTLLFAFACFYPNEEILLFFILPIKVKWVAWMGAATTAFLVISMPLLIVPVFFSHLNFLLAFGPDFVRQRMHMAQVTQRRQRFESAQPTEGDFFHQCGRCGKTELDDPALDFRVSDEGEEVCNVCRAKS